MVQWNLILGENTSNPLELELEYGKKYYKDYKINLADINFTDYEGNIIPRQFFYSPLGEITDEDISGSTNITTTGWFKGLFNWTTLGNWLSFDGSTLNFNETKLNNSITQQGLNNGFNSTFNSTYDEWAYNQTYTGGTYNATYDAKVTDNESWSQVLANTLYTGIQWAYNQTQPAIDFTINNFFNKTETNSIVLGNKSEVNSNIEGNISNVRTDINGNFTELNNLKLNKTDQRYNDTNLINAVNLTLYANAPLVTQLIKTPC